VYLIAGLGNPGPKYNITRHNIGFRVITQLADNLMVHLTGKRFQSKNTRTTFQDNKIILLCPLTFMNESGKSVKACADYYKLDIKDIIVIRDDLYLPAGRIKVVETGGAGGHKGVLSIIKHLGGNDFTQVKIGIGRPRYGELVENYVLSPCYDDEKDIMRRVLRMAIQACELFVLEGTESAMNHINCQNLAN